MKLLKSRRSFRKLDSNYLVENRFDICSYLKVEMLGLGEPGVSAPLEKQVIQNFFSVPFALEKLILLGCVICLDAFLYVLTYLPIRVVFSSWLLLDMCWKHFIGSDIVDTLYSCLFVTASRAKRQQQQQQQQRHFSFHRTHLYDLMRGIVLGVGFAVLMQINMSRVYHFIRGQSMIKLYVLTSMMEVVDKLLGAFGQDVFAALHSQTRHSPRSYSIIVYFLVAVVYVVVHASLYFLHVATLTVVINSADETLITVLILNNFSEMKSFVFKKFDSNNLFQLACTDITERFQLSLFLATILLVAAAQADSFADVLPPFARIATLVVVGEVAVDSMKHAFINKFNNLSAAVYQDFAYVLRGDVLNERKDAIVLDHTYSVARRVGLSQIPLGCVVLRYMALALSAPRTQAYIRTLSAPSTAIHALGVFALLVLLKVAVGVGLVFYASSERAHDAELLVRSPAPVAAPRQQQQQRTVNKVLFPAALAKEMPSDQKAKVGASHRGAEAQPSCATEITAEVPANTTCDSVHSTPDATPLVPVDAAMPQDEETLRARLEFMAELSGMERFTVYKGRVMA